MNARVVVVGSGIAGLTAALTAAAAGAVVTLVTKRGVADGATALAQGGIAGVMTAADSPASHAVDTLSAGADLGDPAAVDVLVGEGPDRIRDLIAAGVPFDRDAAGALRMGLEAAHSHARILHAGGDATGAAIERTLVARMRDEPAITVLEHTFLADLVVTDARVTGVELIGTDGAPRTIRTDAVILATGGAGQLYAHTTNPAVATGDGIAAALRAGAAVDDLEFVQFHPTVLAVGSPFLISEAVRGEGAVLRAVDGRRFAFDAHPDGELAPRDVVARAIARQVAAQGGQPVLLDATALGGDDTAAFLARRFPTIDAVLRSRGIDWSRESVPVTPAAHYLMGGVVTDLDGRATLPGLFAVGETARTGVHGANRLASNSLLEGAVFGARAAAAATSRRPGSPAAAPARTTPTAPPVAARHASAPFSRAALQELLWRHAGLTRDAAGLAEADAVLAAWSASLPAAQSVAAREDANLLLVARALIAAAARRATSVGAHFRRDDHTAAAPRPSALQEAAAC
ncbi:L-aspartate oxidase [Microbacterium sp. NPDC089189]|uniref:L-aspartate oxidase n=1 Tax=Microbacterium sp. NPDC089189 TaxID=3154972 RepID=UPI00342632E0